LSFQNSDISTNNLKHDLCIRKSYFLMRLKIERDKEYFRHLLLYYFD